MCFVACTCIWKVAWYTVHVCCEVSFGVHVIITCSNYYCWLVIIYYYYTVCAVMEFRILWLLSPLLSVSLILWDCYISTCRSCLICYTITDQHPQNLMHKKNLATTYLALNDLTGGAQCASMSQCFVLWKPFLRCSFYIVLWLISWATCLEPKLSDIVSFL